MDSREIPERHDKTGKAPAGGFDSLPRRQEIGLGDATAIESIEIRWPSGLNQRFEDLPMDAFYEITEGADAPRRYDPPRFAFGK